MRRALGKRLHPQRIRRTLGAASCVRRRGRFVFNELRDEPAEREYELRESGLTAVVRHPLLDMWAIEEMFRLHAYRPPPEAARAIRALGPAPQVLDLGGHIGCFGLFLRGLLPEARVVSFEPDPSNARILRRCVETNALGDRWEVVEACAATSDGVVDFASDYHLSRVVAGPVAGNEEMHDRIGATFPFLRDTPLLSAEPRRVQSRDVFPHLAEADFVKMDIEGSEWEILADERIESLRARVIVLEYHPVYTTASDPASDVTRSLAAAGYEVGAADRSHDAGVIWAWRDPGRSS